MVGTFSNMRPIVSGIPQSSVLEPLFSLIFVSDLTNGLDSAVF